MLMGFEVVFISVPDWVWNGKRFIQVSTDWEGSVAVQSVNKYLIKLLETVEKGSRLIVELSQFTTAVT